MAAVKGVSRRRRVAGGRPVVIKVRFTEDEAQTLAERAEGAGMTSPAFLAVCALTDSVDDVGVGSPTAGVAWRNAAAAELLAVVRQARGIANNLNQLTAYTHTEKRLDDDISRAIVEVRTFMTRAIQVADRLDPRRPR